MAKIVRLTESDLIKIIKRAINEEEQYMGYDSEYEFIPHWSDSISPKEMERLEKKFRDEDEEERKFPKEQIIDVKSYRSGSEIFIYGDYLDAGILSFSSKNAYDLNSGVTLAEYGEGNKQMGLVDYIKYVIQKWNEYYSRNNRPNPKIIFKFNDEKLMNKLSNYYDKNNIPKPEFIL